LKTAFTVSRQIAVLPAVVLVGGTVIPNFCRTNNAFLIASALGNDAVTLFMAVLLLIAAAVAASCRPWKRSE
jgi:hypothetical protein